MLDEPQAETSPPEPVPQETTSSEPVLMSPEAPESPKDAESVVPVNNQNEPVNPENGQIKQTAQTDNPSSNEALSKAPESQTAQLLVFEPFTQTA